MYLKSKIMQRERSRNEINIQIMQAVVFFYIKKAYLR